MCSGEKDRCHADCEADGLQEHCGYTRAAQALLMLSNVLQKRQPGELILLLGFGQGCDALVFRATNAIGGFRPVRGVADALADAQSQDSCLPMLAYDEGIELEWGMRSEKIPYLEVAAISLLGLHS